MRLYSAEAVTDIVQTLADGNRIVRQNKAQISRDSQGRTRREQGFAMFGPLVNGPRGNELRNVQISDPTTGTMVMLDLQSRTAHRMTGAPRMMLRNKIAAGDAKAGVNVETINVEKFEMAVPAPPGAGAGASGGVMFNRDGGDLGDAAARSRSSNRSALSSWKAWPSKARARRMTIPAGQIGNEQPITSCRSAGFRQT